ncbi:MAG TPA: efflux RND transporter periplasmic adaptor subunit [Thermoanaerobaculia bacterium]|nr:efflux RND transporter periplasmic adaptor subunit [Thermoanaerobaculia bacterium]
MTEPRDRLAELRIDRDREARRGAPRALLLALAALLVLGAAGAALWRARATAPEVRLATVEAAAPGEGSRRAVLDASGYVVARRKATVSSKVTGKVVEILIEEGTVVEEGQVLARLDSSLQTRQVALAQAQVEAARRALAETDVLLREAAINLGRTRELVEAEVATAAVLDADQAAVDALAARLERQREEVAVAERQLAIRRQELDDMVIRAPFDGVAVTKDAQPGEMISPVSAGGGFTRTGVGTIVDMESLEIEVDVNEAFINRVERGQRVIATLDAYPDWRIPARVITPVPTADRQKATVKVRIAFEELDPRILPDMGIKVSFLAEEPEAVEGGAPASAVALAPEAAVRSEGGQPVVLVLDGDTVERRAIRLGVRRGEQVEVIAGLEPGERVVVEGPADLADGDRVAVRERER